MTFFAVALNVIAPIVLVVSLGAALARAFNPDPRTLSSLGIYLFAPCLVLDGIANSPIQPADFVKVALHVALLSAVMVVLGFALSRLLGFDRRLESAFVITILLMNAANYGLPLNEFAFGEEGLQWAMVFYVNSTVIVNSVGVFLASRGTVSARQALLNTVKVPLFYALLLGLALNFTGTALPLPVQRVVTLLARAAVPLMMAVLGIQLTRARVRGRLLPIALATVAKLVIAPAVGLLAAVLLGITGVPQQVMVLQSATPTAIMAGVLATEFGSDGEFTSSVTLVSTLVSVLTLNVLLTLIT